ncbi:tyrosine-type recombinase/integrase [Ralstonia syzygii]|uniref:Tyrosine-type recombinase/integrase n=1 Tax=Ralstonia syzygii TaxID=28097 RepID=A0ABX7ZFB9_9RALS|nr:site-specific integrase [Ralstonia syzygii]QUP53514.1 tyrosine-type recombinase/integrase [Ralstonia syzygii]
MAYNIQKRGNVYYFRRRIPFDLIDQHAGKREIVRSLGTKDRAEAERLARKVSVDLDDEWLAMRASQPKVLPTDWSVEMVDGGVILVPPPGGWPKPRELTPAEQEDWERYQLEAAEEVAKLNAQEDAQAEADEVEADKLERVLAIVERRRAEAGLAPLPQDVRLTVAPQRAAKQAAGPSAEAKRPAATGTNLESLIPIWKRERKPAEKTVQSAMRTVAELGDPDVSTITRQTIIAYRDKLLDAGKAVNTINTRLSFIRILLGLAKDRGLVEVNHAADATLAEDKRAVDKRKPYSPEQIAQVMHATAGGRDSDPAMYWLPRLARWTGARLNELHQLRKDDVQTREGVTGLLITDEGEHAPGVALRLKNAGSRRWVPLAEPVQDFAGWIGKRPDGPLFPAAPNKYGIVSDGFSKRYGRFLRDTLKIKDKRVTFHSWRHGFADMCRAAGVAPDVRMALMGHTEGGVSGTYGSGDGMPPRRLIEAVMALSAL